MDHNEAEAIINKAAMLKQEELQLEGLGLPIMPQAIGALLKLGGLPPVKRLLLANNVITALLPEIGSLNVLEELDVRNNRLSQIPSEIRKLRKLRSVLLGKNRFTELPEDLCFVPSIAVLDLADNQIPSLPPTFNRMVSLTSLDLSRNRLSMFPPELCQLLTLTSLTLDGNSLDTLPPAINALQRLATLGLNNNRITSLPAHLADLQKLERLHITNNAPALTAAFPVEPLFLLMRFGSLRTLVLGEALAVTPQIIQGGPDNVFRFLEVVSKFNLTLNAFAHWVPDEQREVCHSCKSQFSFFNRRHHCRVCGEVFCSKCCSRKVTLPCVEQGASLACTACFNAIRAPSTPAQRPPVDLPTIAEWLGEYDDVQDLINFAASVSQESTSFAAKQASNMSKIRQSMALCKGSRGTILRPRSGKVTGGGVIPRHVPTVKARALWDFDAMSILELSFLAGDILTIAEKSGEWWFAALGDDYGYVPASYLESLT